MLESLPFFHTRNAQDSRIREWPTKKYLRNSLKPDCSSVRNAECSS